MSYPNQHPLHAEVLPTAVVLAIYELYSGTMTVTELRGGDNKYRALKHRAPLLREGRSTPRPAVVSFSRAALKASR